MKSQEFYHRLTSFHDFQRVGDDSIYKEFPEDWSLILTDVPGSTKAIESGQYKQINVLGATSIAAALNVCGEIDVPFVFGGDGATFVIPNELKEKVIIALRMTRWMARYRFGHDIRIGMFPARDVRVAKFHLSPQMDLAMLSGEGLRAAEALLKDPDRQREFYQKYLPIEPRDETFYGLECRWNPLRPRRGVIFTLIVQAKKGEVYESVLRYIDQSFGSIATRPVSEQSVDYHWPPKNLWDEVRVKSANRSVLFQFFLGLKTLALSILGNFLFRHGFAMRDFDPKRYFPELIENSDYRKFDNCLRLVLDLSPTEVGRLREFLEEKRRHEEIVYGAYESHEALMTCLVFSSQKHVHFIDGGGGGYAMAAQALKAQMRPSNLLNQVEIAGNRFAIADGK